MISEPMTRLLAAVVAEAVVQKDLMEAAEADFHLEVFLEAWTACRKRVHVTNTISICGGIHSVQTLASCPSHS